jgi:hypothetical protein
MWLALTAIGWFLFVDLKQTPLAVVILVVIYNAAFGYRCRFIATASRAF